MTVKDNKNKDKEEKLNEGEVQMDVERKARMLTDMMVTRRRE